MSMFKWLAEQGIGRKVKTETLRSTKNRQLLRVMITHVLKDHNT